MKDIWFILAVIYLITTASVSLVLGFVYYPLDTLVLLGIILFIASIFKIISNYS